MSETALAVKKRPDGSTELALFPGPTPEHPAQIAIVKETRTGAIRSFVIPVRLYASENHMYPQRKEVDRKWVTVQMITAEGYDYLNKYGGVNRVVPPLLDEKGRPCRNPDVVRNENGDILRVCSRLAGIGYSPTGNLVAHDITKYFDVQAYLAQDLFSKWKGKAADTPKEWGKLRPTGTRPVGCDDWAPYSVDGGLTLWVNLDHLEALNITLAHSKRRKFADSMCVSMCWRNVLKKFYAVSKVPDCGIINIVAWTHTDRDYQDMAQLLERANAGDVTAGAEDLIVNEEVVPAGAGEDSAFIEAEATTIDDTIPGEEPDAPPAAGAPVDPLPAAPAKNEDTQPLVAALREESGTLIGLHATPQAGQAILLDLLAEAGIPSFADIPAAPAHMLADARNRVIEEIKLVRQARTGDTTNATSR